MPKNGLSQEGLTSFADRVRTAVGVRRATNEVLLPVVAVLLAKVVNRPDLLRELRN